MVGRGLWAVATGIAASCALALALGRLGSPPSASRAAEAGSPFQETPADVSASPKALGGEKPASAGDETRSSASLDALESEVLERVNRHRRAAGLGSLRSDPRIAEIARAHSRAMASGRRWFGHGDFDDRAQAVEARVARYQRIAENVARQSRRRSDLSARAVSGWLQSSGHRHNIEGPYSLTGVGIAVSGRGEVYLTQIFVAPR